MKDTRGASSSIPVPSEPTSLDLGGDLLPKKKRDPGLVSSLEKESLTELLKNAKIFLNEGFIEDAKKLFRRVLILDPFHQGAKAQLEKIFQKELTTFLNEEKPPSKYQGVSPFLFQESEMDQLIQNLDQDFNLDLKTPSNGLFFSSLEEVNQRIHQWQNQKFQFHDWVDLGIAFLEMNLAWISIPFFETAWKQISLDSDQRFLFLHSITALLALAYLLEKRPLEAILRIQQFFSEYEGEGQGSIELLYLLGRAHEEIQDVGKARTCYQRVIKKDLSYRDVQKRLSRLV